MSNRDDVQWQRSGETNLEPARAHKPNFSDPAAHTPRLTRVSLESEVEQFTRRLQQLYPNRVKRRPQAFKRRVQSLIGLHLPPRPKPSGRPQESRITKATALYVQQLREVAAESRERVTWHPIASRCIAGYRKIRSTPKRQAELKKLRDAVYRRLRCRATGKVGARTDREQKPGKHS